MSQAVESAVQAKEAVQPGQQKTAVPAAHQKRLRDNEEINDDPYTIGPPSYLAYG